MLPNLEYVLCLLMINWTVSMMARMADAAVGFFMVLFLAERGIRKLLMNTYQYAVNAIFI